MDNQGEITYATVEQIIGKTGKHIPTRLIYLIYWVSVLTSEPAAL